MQTFSVRYFHLPRSVRGATIWRDGRAFIFINQDLTERQQKRILKHELAHIYLNHIDDPRPIDIIEREADRYAARMTEEEFTAMMMYNEEK